MVYFKFGSSQTVASTRTKLTRMSGTPRLTSSPQKAAKRTISRAIGTKRYGKRGY